ncbi:DUF6768 family protein [Candidatus Viadribacter manganicus]|uniref:Uncharacterized protein n=1 Tax=Candidatus Viadribacter manganicus TaxID=1759059 RepID=A0A1B1AH74_9PROT|nr:DUF6768 family protein [Candidatus Viadribacter manganicus]ANP45891.1 hypothetical protein ATE48_08135 [Candidatus Viadribacter manganicus]
MNKLDSAIRQALSAEDAAFLAKFEDQSPLHEALGTFSGKWGVMNVFAALVTFAMFGAAVFCAWNAFTETEVRDTILWSAGVVLAMLAVAMLKMYFWMEINKNVTLREVKRLELQVARLAAHDKAQS